MTIRGHDRAIDGGRDRCVAEDHEAAGAQDDRPAADSSAENWKGVEDIMIQISALAILLLYETKRPHPFGWGLLVS